jgi:hypothetical protein
MPAVSPRTTAPNRSRGRFGTATRQVKRPLTDLANREDQVKGVVVKRHQLMPKMECRMPSRIPLAVILVCFAGPLLVVGIPLVSELAVLVPAGDSGAFGAPIGVAVIGLITSPLLWLGITLAITRGRLNREERRQRWL